MKQTKEKPDYNHEEKLPVVAKLYISCQLRDCNIGETFSQENNLYLTSLSKNADLQPTKKIRFIDMLRRSSSCYIQNIGS